MWIKRLVAALTAACAFGALGILQGCGGAGSPVQVAGGGQDGTGVGPDVVISGVVTGLGSVVVGGIRFDTANAAITVDGVAGKTQSDLQVGMVVTVAGKLDASGISGVASKVDYRSVIKGTIDQVAQNGNAKTLSILGQLVDVDGNTQVQAAAPGAPLQAGQYVQVSGFRQSSGATRATLVDADAQAGSANRVSGLIGNLNDSTFQINNLTINYKGAQIVNAPPGGLRGLLFVAVELGAPAQNGQANATRVQVLATEIGADVKLATALGVICTLGPDRFLISAQEVAVLPGATFVGGTAADLRNDVTVKAEGVTDANGVLQASKITFLPGSPDSEVNAVVAAIDATALRVTLLGAPGITAQLAADTLLSDISGSASDTAPQPLALSQLRAGDTVQVFGKAQAGNVLRASVLKKRAPVAAATLYGPLQSFASPTLTLLGVQVQTNSTTVFVANNDQTVTQADFFALLSNTSQVRAEGSYAGGAFTASRVVLAVP
ncbi:MAG: DUF5666 domain-containing protein [Burkholderiaceae bacterium]